MARDDTLVYDVGLHIGEDAEYYLKLGYRVVAIEANPRAVAFCQEKFAAEIAAGRLTIVQGAVAPPGAPAKVKFFLNNSLSIWSTANPVWLARNDKQNTQSVEIEVDALDMRDVFAKYGVPYFLKIDVEGADHLALEALGDFADRPQFVSVEVNTVELVKARRDLRTLDRLGYRQFQLAPQWPIQGTRIRRKTLSGESVEHVFAEGASGPFGEDLTGVWFDRDAALTAITSETWQDTHATLTPSDEINVALRRPATQSSTDPESNHPAAAVATNGDVFSPLFFQTAQEYDPWWQVDLGGGFHIDKIVLFNRSDFRGHLRHFTVWGWLDKRDWTPMLKKTSDELFRVFAANVAAAAPARYVRVQLDGFGRLNFRECQLFGRPAAAVG